MYVFSLNINCIVKLKRNNSLKNIFVKYNKWCINNFNFKQLKDLQNLQ